VSPKRSVKIITVQQPRDSLAELQAWYVAHADGDWEHSQGITIETLDNPGWSLKIDLAATDLVDRPLKRHEQHRADDDWVAAWREALSFHAACGPRNLTEALDLFLDWATRPA
jgi:hypothetical protein